MNKLLVGLLLAASLASAQAAPTVSISGQTAGQDHAFYSGAAAIGSGAINDANTLFVVQEKQVAGQQSWLFFADPSALTRMAATLSFNVPILAVYTSRTDLVASSASFGIDVDGDGRLNDYANRAAMGLEATDILTYTLGGNTLRLDWRVQAAGDTMRVLTAVPEPGSLALLALGLLAIGLKLRQRRS